MFQEKYLPIIMQEIRSIRKKYGLSIEKVVNGCLETIVYINSAKNKEKQNFCAAHELGHRHKLERQLRDAFPDDIFLPSTIESVMNRFAAELMMPSKDFEVRSRKLYKRCLGRQNDKELIFVKKLMEAIVELMDFYYVPYRAVVIWLQETNIITKEVGHVLQDYEKNLRGENVINATITERGITRLRIPDRKVQYSKRLDNINNILKNTDVTKYMGTNEFKKYLKEMEIVEEDIQLSEDMKKSQQKRLILKELNMAKKKKQANSNRLFFLCGKKK